ncbi:MAG: glycoside hydrolase family 97 catalytic domain-containing protein [Haloarculaceae archaeon]
MKEHTAIEDGRGTDAQQTDGDGVSRTRRSVIKSAAVAGVLPAVAGQASAATSWTVTSPEGTNEATVTLSGGSLSITISHGGTTMVASSSLGLTTANQDFTSGLSFQSQSERTVSDSYTTTSGNQLSHAYDATVTTLAFTNANGAQIELDVHASSKGVAYRYRIPGSGTVEVTGESSSFTIPGDPNAWVMPFSNDGCSTCPGDYYENNWRQVTTSNTSGQYGWGSLFEITSSDYLVLGEADVTRQYCTTRIESSSGSTTFTTTLAESSVADSEPLETPWRVAIMGDLLSVAESDMITDLNDAAAISDDSWVQPGRSAWSWWSDGEVTSLSNQKAYIDFAEKHGWEYYLVDVGWKSNLGSSGVQELIDYAETVDILLWSDRDDLDTATKRDNSFSNWSSWGVAGIKVDYFDNDDQATMQLYQDILADAAAYDLAVNFHGSTIPKGWKRKWPNLLTMEAIQGAEYYKWDTVPVDHNNIVPFTRNVLGPMDYTPVTFSASGRSTTAAHELALSVVQETGQMHYADNYSEYENWPTATRFLDTAAAAWADTRFLGGYPGDYVAVARQKPNSPLWHVGAISNQSRTIDVDLSFLSSGTYEYELTSDDGNGGLAVSTGTATDGDTLSQSVPDNGGFTVLLYPQDGTAPTAPSNLSSPSQGSSTVELSWDGSSDGETEVHHYNVYVDGSKYEQWNSTHARIDGLSSGTTYDIAVTAVDVAGNESGASNTITVTTDSGVIGEGTYRITSVNSGKLLEVAFAGTDNGDNVRQYSDTGCSCQEWRVIQNSDGTYRLENANSGKVADVYQSGTQNGDNVIQWDYHGGDNQKWDIIENSDGTYRLENANSGKVLDVYQASTDDGANVIQWEWNGGDNQKWTFTHV